MNNDATLWASAYLSQNDNGIIDVPDVSSSVGHTAVQRQRTRDSTSSGSRPLDAQRVEEAARRCRLSGLGMDTAASGHRAGPRRLGRHAIRATSKREAAGVPRERCCLSCLL